MDTEFLEKYTAALNRATELTIKVQKKGILDEVADAQLIRDFHEANAEVDRLSKILLASQ
jgi:hypothetical protein